MKYKKKEHRYSSIPN